MSQPLWKQRAPSTHLPSQRRTREQTTCDSLTSHQTGLCSKHRASILLISWKEMCPGQAPVLAAERACGASIPHPRLRFAISAVLGRPWAFPAFQ